MKQCDVLVAGAGFAGILAAASAAQAGAKVILVSSGAICSGSSFYPGTWGFGLVGPESDADVADMVETIIRVGEGVLDRTLVQTFVEQILDGIAYLKNMGVPLRVAEHKGEREFIPCFDYKSRLWHGLVKEEAKPVFLKHLEELGVELCPNTEVTELLQDEEGVHGAFAVQNGKRVIRIESKAVILASGGLGGLFEHRLNPGDVTGVGQYLAWRAGARLVNLEFMQMMPAYLEPAYGTVFNEKVFRYANSDAFSQWDAAERTRLLELRSGHGPYTSRLESGRVDEALMRYWQQHPQGAAVCYDALEAESMPEFVRTYFDWLKQAKELSMEDPVHVGIFAHASNGGIHIDRDGKTGVPGLYACGEATGGMHGADRLGGLSTANALVFGRSAGAAAAKEAKEAKEAKTTEAKDATEPTEATKAAEKKLYQYRCDHRQLRSELRHKMSQCAMIDRDEKTCEKMLDWLKKLEVQWNGNFVETCDVMAYLESCRLQAQLGMAACMVQAILLRRESRGSHHRTDFPNRNPKMERMLMIHGKGIHPAYQWNKIEGA